MVHKMVHVTNEKSGEVNDLPAGSLLQGENYLNIPLSARPASGVMRTPGATSDLLVVTP